jgi:hypothetical protein
MIGQALSDLINQPEDPTAPTIANMDNWFSTYGKPHAGHHCDMPAYHKVVYDETLRETILLPPHCESPHQKTWGTTQLQAAVGKPA